MKRKTRVEIGLRLLADIDALLYPGDARELNNEYLCSCMSLEERTELLHGLSRFAILSPVVRACWAAAGPDRTLGCTVLYARDLAQRIAWGCPEAWGRFEAVVLRSSPACRALYAPQLKKPARRHNEPAIPLPAGRDARGR